MRLIGKENYREYHTFFLSSLEEQQALRNALTINVTKFWRDQEVFDILQREILPELMRKKNRIRIWSGGCATGEEPYTVALIAHDLLRMKKDISVHVHATDIDDEVLRHAKEGIYNAKSVENLSSRQIRRHFISLPDSRYEVKPHLKEMVRFTKHDLMSGRPPVNFLDIILCRNVTIYFNEQQKNELAQMFHSALLKGGYYIMGKTEFLGRELEDFFIPYNSTQKIYQNNHRN